MNNFRYENQGTNTYLVYEINEDDTIDSMSLGMLTNNRIPGLAQTSFTQMNMRKYVQYNVTAKVSVSQFFSGAVNKKRLVGVFNGIVNALISAEEYMIDARSIILNMDYIFTDVSTCETVLVCLPLENSTEEVVDLGMFFKGIMFNTQFEQTENSDHVAKIINYLNGTPVFSLYDFKKVLDEIDGNDVMQMAQGASQVQSIVHPIAQPVMQQVAQPNMQSSVPVQSQQNVSTPIVPPMQSRESVAPTQKEVKSNVPPMPNMPPMTSAPIKGEKKSTFSGGTKAATPPPVPQKIGGMNIPGAPKKQESVQPQATVGDKEISWFYLMQHYNKENAATYKAQKEAKKEAKKNSAGSKKGKRGTDIEVPGTGENGIAIPGHQNVQDVSNQPTAAQTPTQAALFQAVQGTATLQQTNVQQSVVQQSFVQQANVQQNVIQQPIMPTSVGTSTTNFGETVVLSTAKIGETTVLTQALNPAQQIPYLFHVKNSEKILLDKPLFRIGKERSFVDYFIVDNTAISRFHAQIVNRDGSYYIIDMNSTNHTFVNGIMINSSEERKLSEGDKIRLANEEFEFYLR